VALKNLKIVRPKRLYEQIAEQIAEQISAGAFPLGNALPSERELAEAIGVSRPSVREALIALEILGFVETRLGGGTYVRSSAGMPRPISIWGRSDLGPGPLEQFEARRVVEIACVDLAVDRISEAELDNLNNSVERMKLLIARIENPAQEHLFFHTELANASRNQILASTVAELWRARKEAMWSALRNKVEHPESWRLGVASRERLIIALRAHDRAEALATIRDHFNRVSELYFGPGKF
jgi:DNA-binding FadR family transcriptional regulator